MDSNNHTRMESPRNITLATVGQLIDNYRKTCRNSKKPIKINALTIATPTKNKLTITKEATDSYWLLRWPLGGFATTANRGAKH